MTEESSTKEQADPLAAEILPPIASDHEIMSLLERYPLPPNSPKRNYGTAGFREKAECLEPVMVRVGLLAALRAGQLGHAVGVMVTASHNDESYNGVKLADPSGGMMAPDGEQAAVQFVNAPDVTVLQTEMARARSQAISSVSSVVPEVHVGRDTRSHAPRLAELVVAAARSMGARVVDHGVVTTPMLHAAVLHANPSHVPDLIPVSPGKAGYYKLLCSSYAALLQTSSVPSTTTTTLLVDCACGVGYPHVEYVAKQLAQLGLPDRIVATNQPSAGPLNEGCGSEHVQKGLVPPTWYEVKSIAQHPKAYCASLDGDADRIVFLSLEPEYALLDGDKIACLMCDFLQGLVAAVQTGDCSNREALPTLKLGVVQTAYANGASTAYLKSVLGEDHVLIAKTGVKHVHATAHDNFDIGVYFEANGHGTVLFGSAFYDFVKAAESALTSETDAEAQVALARLKLLPCLINPAVGDALSDLLFVDAILQLTHRSVDDWKALYQDFPSRQTVVKVADRTMIQTNENETQCLAPPGLQGALQSLMDEHSTATAKARAFVRPSGTEDVVRVYAEAATREAADALATAVAALVHAKCQGQGTPPVFSS